MRQEPPAHAVFGQTAGFSFVHFDDDVYVYQNAKVAGGLSCQGLAWLLATCPDGSVRDGQKALQLARQANELTGGNSFSVVCTLATPCAATRNFGFGTEAARTYNAPMTADIRSLTQEDLLQRFAGWQQPAYRVQQLLEWLYVHRVENWEAMSNLSKELRGLLQQTYTLHAPALVRRQGSHESAEKTQKFLWRLADGALIESVLIPASANLFGEASDRHTLCVSTQVGCAYGCKFCASGLEGWKRNLQPDEIVNQLLAVERCAGLGGSGRLVNNLVIMGMGEPLANYDNLLRALKILNAPWGANIGARKITISTSGLAPQIRRLAEEPFQFRLAVSLHGATDETRGKIMPVNKKYPLEELAAACEYYQDKKSRMMTLEYILIAGVNDGLNQTKPLAKLARRLHAKINLIPYNKVEGLPWNRPDEATQDAFLAALEREKVSATLRREKGHDIDAACGQLRLRTEQEEESGRGPYPGRNAMTGP